MIELVMVMAIIGLLAAVALPTYQRYTARGNRATAKAFLNDLAQRQASFFADRKRYARTLADLGYADNGVPATTLNDTALIDEAGNPYFAADPKRTYYYQVTLVQNPTAAGGATSVRSCKNMTSAPTAATYGSSTIAPTTPPAWAATAIPLGSQARSDKRCSTLCLNGTGRQGASGDPADTNNSDGWQTCWRG